MLQPVAKRPENEIFSKNLKLVFGDDEYTVPVRRAGDAAEWREEYFKRTKEVSEAMPQHFAKADDPGELSKAIGYAVFGALLKYPAKIPELIFSYAPSLNEYKEKITSEAYDADYSRAFKQIWQVAFGPFLDSLGMVIEMQRAQDSVSPSAASSN
jgi:hypothetical protein